MKNNQSVALASLLAIFFIVVIVLLSDSPLTGSAIFKTCFQSDPGLDYYTKGYAEYGSRRWEDTCSSDGMRLKQAYCSSSVRVSTTFSYQCPYGCADGVCLAPDTNCGNGMIESGEGCDDGNNINGDGCSNGCTKETGFTCRTTSICTIGS